MNATGMFARRELPPGVTDRYARRRLAEARVAMYDAMANERATANERDLKDDAAHAFQQLAELHTEETRERLTIRWTSDEEAAIALSARPVAMLARTADRVDTEARGWWLWGVDADGQADERGGAWPQLVDEALDAEREQLEHAAVEAIAHHVGSDLAKGFAPFGPGGIAGGPPPA